MRRVGLIFLAVLLLVSCSTVKLVYKRLDWVIPFYVGKYISLNDEQSDALDQYVDEILTWHCSLQLPEYARWLSASNDDFQRNPLTYEKVASHNDVLNTYWNNIIQQVTPKLSLLLLTATNEQIDELLQSLKKDNDKFKKNYVDIPLEQMQENYEEWMSHRLERWLGTLTAEQKQAIQAWRKQVIPLGAKNLQERERWQTHFRQTLNKRDKPDLFFSEIDALFMTPEYLWPEDYHKIYDINQRNSMALVVTVTNQSTIKQRKHMDKKVKSLVNNIEDLVCTGSSEV